MQQYLSSSEVWAISAASARRCPSFPIAGFTSGFCSLHSSQDSRRCCSQRPLQPAWAGSSPLQSSAGQGMAAVRRPSAASPITAFGSQTEVPRSRGRAGLHPVGSIPVFQSTCNSQEVWDVVGLGQGMVDFSAQVDDALLERLQVEKGARRLVLLKCMRFCCLLVGGICFWLEAWRG